VNTLLVNWYFYLFYFSDSFYRTSNKNLAKIAVYLLFTNFIKIMTETAAQIPSTPAHLEAGVQPL
jgi:hypothetical protein